jgi:hypothetical protein
VSKLCGTIHFVYHLELIRLLHQDLTEFGAFFTVLVRHYWICMAPLLFAWIGSYSLLVAIIVCMLTYCLCLRQCWPGCVQYPELAKTRGIEDNM